MTLDEHMTSHDCTGSWCLGCPRCGRCGFRIEAHDGEVDCGAAARLAARLADAAPNPDRAWTSDDCDHTEQRFQRNGDGPWVCQTCGAMKAVIDACDHAGGRRGDY
jgi:hypothetical protein